VTIAVLDTRSAGFAPAFERLERRRSATRSEVEASVRTVVEDVRSRGDAAILDATERFDGYRPRPADLCVSPEEIAGARERLAPEDRDALALAAARIRTFHSRQIPASWRARSADELLGQEVRPISRVGVYVPAVQAPLASSVLMLAIPASVAGVPEIVMATPGREIHPAVLEAARLAEIDRVFRIGGAQAIAALAFGTETVPRVDKIVGPGSAYTQAAKRLVFGDVGIDSEAGPSEVFIVADASASPEHVAADLLAQAEHEEHASVVLATPVGELIQETEAELARQLADLPRREVATASLRNHGALLRTRDLDEAMALANRFAPEHLELLVRDPESWLSRVEHAGAVFLGPHSPVPMGDYLAGPSHVLPTGGTARFFSPIGVEDFQKRISVIGLEAGALARLGPSVVRLATLEGLDGHARAVQRRLDRAPSKAGP
jgi:histidinol dehydrogenase